MIKTKKGRQGRRIRTGVKHKNINSNYIIGTHSLFKLKCDSYHLKFSFQLNPPQVISEAVIYSKDSSEITSIIGHTTVFLFSTILAKRGSSQPSVHSQWASKKVITWPVTCWAPKSRARMRPERFSVLRTCTETGSVFTYCSSFLPRCSGKNMFLSK